ncbi:TetR family transcriptional regulator [Nocardioides aromaticivorans]|uniref:Putative transcriptional regulator n=1 Tax=Nocardioides aromaticivorans TaxID=200618 RepID=Q2HWI8_9ACTN|nr:TetR/AcrR family transcriptional regulator [Nocardioides aromaticivorans]QSR24152.1 TetR family transcriptional regulator [Nocardioides aromaticivorans]BAE79490.1 putative transcriptional regulator [Nocardioides aromaticivorans]
MLDAALAVVRDNGYNAFSIEDVARRAGTSRPAIYRRFAGRAPLLLAAVQRRRQTVAPPDTGCTICDLSDAIKLFTGADPMVPPEIWTALLADCHRDPDLLVAFDEAISEPLRVAVRSTLASAARREDLLSDLETDVTVDLIASWARNAALVNPGPLRDDRVEQIVHVLLRGLASTTTRSSR